MTTRRTTRLSTLDYKILDSLSRIEFATRAQLAYWCGINPATASKTMARLLDIGLLSAVTTTRPAIWHLSHSGAQIVNAKAPTDGRKITWSVMAHACHRNALEIELTARNGQFRFLSRQALLRQGFNPAHGEHAGVDGGNRCWFVLLDDYLMASRRIARSWQRRHAPDRNHWPDPMGRTWCEVMQRYLVCCTDAIHAESHRAWIATHDIPADLMEMKPLWPQ